LNLKYHILAASFLLSILLWISLNLNQSYEIQRTIPVKLNIEKPYASANTVPQTLEVRFKGTGWNLLRLYTSMSPEFVYDVNTSRNESVIFTRQYLADNLGFGQLFTISNIKPESLYVRLGKYEEKYVKIQPRVYVVCSEGYQVVGNPVITPDSIKIGGSSEILKNLNYIYSRDVIFKNVNSNINQSIRLTDSLANITWRPVEEVNINIKIELTAEKEFSNVTLRVANIPFDKDVLLIPQTVGLQVKGGVIQLSELDINKINGFIEYSELIADTTGSVSPKFSLPEGMTIISVKPERIQYVIKRKS
jgi:YbbR domain-containing protein